MPIRESARRYVRERAGECCEYCHLQQEDHPRTLQIEHTIARQHGGQDDLDNLALSCELCNLRKGPNLSTLDAQTRRLVRLFNPRRDRWAEHFRWAGDGVTLVGATVIGRGTVRLLDMNDEVRLDRRRMRKLFE